MHQKPPLIPKTTLEPLTTGDLIDRAVRVYRHNFGALLAIVSIPGLLSYVGSLMTVLGGSKLGQSTSNPVIAGLLLGGGYVCVLLLGPLLNLLAVGGLARSIGDAVMLDQPVSVKRTLHLVWTRFGTLLGGQLLGWVVAGAMMSVGVLVFYFLLIINFLVLASLNPPPWVVATIVAPQVIGLAVGALFAYCAIYSRVIFIPHLIMIEGMPASAALTRSFSLGRGNTWRLAQVFLFDFAIAAAIVAALGIPLVVYAFFAGELDDLQNLSPMLVIAYSTVDQLARLLTIPIGTIAYCLLYFDNRVRKEGYDVELVASRLPAPPFQPFWGPPPIAPRPPVGGVLGL